MLDALNHLCKLPQKEEKLEKEKQRAMLKFTLLKSNCIPYQLEKQAFKRYETHYWRDRKVLCQYSAST